MADSSIKVYWDSNAFLGFLKREPEKIKACKDVIRAAEEGKILIFTSTIVLIEVLYLSRKEAHEIPRSDMEHIRSFFDQSFIRMVTLERWIAHKAQELFWEYPSLGWKDATHIATALQFAIPEINTYDKRMLRLDGKVGDPPIKIRQPMIDQGPLFTSNQTRGHWVVRERGETGRFRNHQRIQTISSRVITFLGIFRYTKIRG